MIVAPAGAPASREQASVFAGSSASVAVAVNARSQLVHRLVAWSLDAGAPAGAAINAATGAFSWTPTEAQGPGVFPITIRATDNGTPF